VIFATESGESVIAIAGYAATLEAVAQEGGCDLVLTSPPYENARSYDADVAWEWKDYHDLGRWTFSALKPGGWCLMVLDGPVRTWRKGMGTERSLTPFRVLLDWADNVGFRVPDRIAYGRFGIPGEYKGRFRNDWEFCFWFQRPGAEGHFDKWAIAEEARRGPQVGNVCRDMQPDGKVRERRQTGKASELGLKQRGTLWNYNSVGNGQEEPEAIATKHPARFSTRFAEDVIKCFSAPDALVCDPFVGSGTTAVASVRNGRRFVGGDLLARKEDKKPWAEVSHERVLAELKKLQAAS
jgi:hypothetical protein